MTAHADAPLGLAGWLGLAASPTFAAMAILAAGEGPMDMLCSAAGGSALGGMSLMYLLMSVFHAAPWLKLVGRWRSAPAA